MNFSLESVANLFADNLVILFFHGPHPSIAMQLTINYVTIILADPSLPYIVERNLKGRFRTAEADLLMPHSPDLDI